MASQQGKPGGLLGGGKASQKMPPPQKIPQKTPLKPQPQKQQQTQSQQQQTAADSKEQKQQLLLKPLNQFTNQRTGSDEDLNANIADQVSLTSRGSDRRKSLQKQSSSNGAAGLSTDDWLLVFNLVSMVFLLVYGTLCVLMHGERKFWVTQYRAFNIGFLLTGCATMTLQLLLTCVYAFQWWTGV